MQLKAAGGKLAKKQELVVGKGFQTRAPRLPAVSFSGHEDKQAPPALGWLKWQFAWRHVGVYRMHLCILLAVGCMEMTLPEVVLTW